MSEKHTAVYCHTGCSLQAGSNAADAQKEELVRFAKERGFDNVRIYMDMGLHGIPFTKRPAFTLLQAEIDTGMVGTVIVKNLSRISRDTADVIGWLRGIQKKGIGFIAADQPDASVDDLITRCACTSGTAD
jgi:DNA invertase Pin-like site-specific DNA recombinase